MAELGLGRPMCEKHFLECVGQSGNLKLLNFVCRNCGRPFTYYRWSVQAMLKYNRPYLPAYRVP